MRYDRGDHVLVKYDAEDDEGDVVNPTTGDNWWPARIVGVSKTFDGDKYRVNYETGHTEGSVTYARLERRVPSVEDSDTTALCTPPPKTQTPSIDRQSKGRKRGRSSEMTPVNRTSPLPLDSASKKAKSCCDRPSKKAAPVNKAHVKGSFGALVKEGVAPHTLLLGTQPSDTSLSAGKYFMNHCNAFWYIVGDALGFRPAASFHIIPGRGKKSSKPAPGPPDCIRPHLLHDTEATYTQAVEALTSRGYFLWDILKSSEREGSTDGAINKKTMVFEELEAFVANHPSIKRIAFVTGQNSAQNFFLKGFKDWIKGDNPRFRAATDPVSTKVFGKWVGTTNTGEDETTIELVVLASCSPAFCEKYVNKRKSWFEGAFGRAGGDLMSY
jgi:G:T/U-mismatch repair DNA glycosylase